MTTKVREVELLGGPADGRVVAAMGFQYLVPVITSGERAARRVQTIYRYAPNGKMTRGGRWVYVLTEVYSQH